MKIEKISDTQLKFILTGDDLAKRNLKVSELAHGSDKAQQLFQEMMQQAMFEFDFETANTPLMMEAVPIEDDGVVVMVTKLTDISEVEQKISLIPQAKAALKFKKPGLVPPPEESSDEDSILIFSFETLDILANAAARLHGQFTGISKAFKMDGLFFLIIKNETENNKTTADLQALLSDFGQKHISNNISLQYLDERGEPLISELAVEKLYNYVMGN